VLRNIGSTWAVTVVGIAATYVLTPFVIHTLGTEGYGIWTLIASITGFISLLAMGVPMACVRYLAQTSAYWAILTDSYPHATPALRPPTEPEPEPEREPEPPAGYVWPDADAR